DTEAAAEADADADREAEAEADAAAAAVALNAAEKLKLGASKLGPKTEISKSSLKKKATAIASKESAIGASIVLSIARFALSVGINPASAAMDAEALRLMPSPAIQAA
ncbi:MAG TPA: hypothetical protein VK999_05565, partial [Methylotenera sp.]|nr:hypothetical protein [Methylotenera sp.]